MDKEQEIMLKKAEEYCGTYEGYVTSDYIAGWKAKTQYEIDKKEKFNKAIKAAADELIAMPQEEFNALLGKQETIGFEPFICKDDSGKIKEAVDLIHEAEYRLAGMMMGTFINVRELDGSIKRVYQEDYFMPTLRKMQQFIAENK